MTQPALITDDSGITRCWWCSDDPQYVEYHDAEWGRPIEDDRLLFEKISLEGFQAGLSWLTILRKRERFREVFAGFDPDRVARFTKRDVNRLVKDVGIIRHRGKIESTINNAQRCLKLIEQEGSLVAFIRRFTPDPAALPMRITRSAIPAATDESRALSKTLKQRGWTFVGPTTMYAMMQAVGVVNDHLEGCAIRPIVEAERAQ